MKKFLIGCAIFVALVIFGVVGFIVYLGVRMESGETPDVNVLLTNEIKKPIMDIIKQNVELAPDETIIFYYSAGLFEHSENMNIITDQRVIVFNGEEENNLVYARYADIANVEFETEGGTFEDSVLMITTKDKNPPFFTVTLSANEGRDKRVVQYINDQLSQDLEP